YRTVIGVENEDQGLLLDVDESKCLRGRVVSAIGLNQLVETEDGRRYECSVRGVVRELARDGRNAVVTGDRVLFQPTGEDQGVIERVEPRRGTVSRTSQGREHVIVANVDQMLIVASAHDPPLKTALIDRFLISAEKGGVRSVLCINKSDLIDPVALQPIIGRYSRLGYDVVLTSAARGTGTRRLRELLADRQTALAGQSGVGKTSLLNALQPGLNLRIGEVSDWTRKGRHTTRRAELLRLEFGGWVVDTPGVRQFGLWDVTAEEVEGHFIEFRPFVTLCKFPDCSHTHEAGCGVKTAVAGDLIAGDRYESYLRIVTGDETS
ncbi:MAG: ribosome small subunit-dependent GTPase A, partial [Planctomycetaceae bacterium]